MLISDKFYAVNIREYLALDDDPEAGDIGDGENGVSSSVKESTKKKTSALS